MSENKRPVTGSKSPRKRGRGKRTEEANTEPALEEVASPEDSELDDREDRRRDFRSEDSDSDRDRDRDRNRDRDRDREPLDEDDDRPSRNEPRANYGRNESTSARSESNSGRGPAPRNREEGGGSKPKGGDEYSIQCHFDRNSRQFNAFVSEFPEVKASAGRRDAAVLEVERKLDQHLANFKRRNESLPEPFSSRRYPERLEVNLSQGLYRRLDWLSRHEKVALEQLVSEILAAGVEKRLEPPKAPERRSQHQSQNQNQQPRHSHNRRGGNQNRNYHDTMDNRENFMEYVRNLEKGGGNWRKK